MFRPPRLHYSSRVLPSKKHRRGGQLTRRIAGKPDVRAFACPVGRARDLEARRGRGVDPLRPSGARTWTGSSGASGCIITTRAPLKPTTARTVGRTVRPHCQRLWSTGGLLLARGVGVVVVDRVYAPGCAPHAAGPVVELAVRDAYACAKRFWTDVRLRSACSQCARIQF